MIDIVTRTVPEYYYHVVTRDDVINGEEEYRKYKEVSYDFSKFTKMGSTSLDNLYSDERTNNIYYNVQINILMKNLYLLLILVVPI